MGNTPTSKQKKLLVKLAIAAVLCIVILVAVARGVDLKALAHRVVVVLSSAGPVAYFGAMALLPCFGVPMLTFLLPAGAVFGERYGLGGVVALCLGAVTVNMMFTYWLARWALRPLFRRLLDRFGYRMPEVAGSDATDLVVILRVTPGIPFFVQNYLAGLADVPLRNYVIVSCIATYLYDTSFVMFGDALLHGRGKLAMVAVGALAALLAVTHMVRKHYAAKSKSS